MHVVHDDDSGVWGTFMTKNANIGVVLVTFNRLGKLKKTLDFYAKQTVYPQYIIVVNNASSDGTLDFLTAWEKEESPYQRIVINLPRNLGGSGGYYVGEEQAMKLSADWIMVADDDAYPAADYIEGMDSFIKAYQGERLAAVCGSVIEKGDYALWHRRVQNDAFSLEYSKITEPKDYEKKNFEVSYISYVGPVMNKAALQEVGLVDKDFFIWNDDIEHMQRLGQYGKMFCIPRYELHHDADSQNSALSWKSYYGLRNNLTVLKRYFPLRYILALMLLTSKAFLCPLKGKCLQEVRMRLTAIKDSLFGNLGIHPVYKPGWSLKK